MMASKILTAFAGMLSIAAVFADEGSTLISFSTAADSYADGAPVMDGEWYALVWSAGEFAGMNLDCTPVNPADEVVYVSPLAVNGHCPDVLFTIPSAKTHADGTYSVYLLDTRNAEKTTVAVADGAKRPLANGAVVSKSFSVVKAEDAPAAASETAVAGSVAWAQSEVDTSKIDGFKPARISAIKIEGAKVKLTVSDMLPGIKYNVRMGSDVSNIKTLAVPVPKTSADPVFVLDQGDARFFKLTRQPLN